MYAMEFTFLYDGRLIYEIYNMQKIRQTWGRK